MTNTKNRAGFLRHFVSGFALGAVALVGVQLADRSEAKPVVASTATIEQVR